jgi:DNA (cytosine-5)-methyltransferase 1
MTAPTIGSLFSGYGGLDLAAEHVLDARTVWTCDLGPGTRTGLWARMADAIDHLRPHLVVAENVRGLLSAAADSDVEPCPWCMGGAADGEPALRALGSVLADLAELGYDAAWHGLRAADVGAPHGRFRVFVLAWPTAYAAGDSSWAGCEPCDTAGRGTAHASRRGPAADPRCERVQRRADPRSVAGTPRTGESEGIQRERRGDASSDASADAADTYCVGLERSEPQRVRVSVESWDGDGSGDPVADPDGVGSVRGGEPRRGRSGPADDGRHSVSDATGDGWDERRTEPTGHVRRLDAPERRATAADAEHGEPGSRGRISGSETVTADGVAWGAYEPAVRRWGTVLGRPAPAPTQPSRNGGQRLSPRVVEWMMGLDDGWVTAVPGLTRNDQLKALGNGVVPQQAAAALSTLLAWRAAAIGEVTRSA